MYVESKTQKSDVAMVIFVFSLSEEIFQYRYDTIIEHEITLLYYRLYPYA